MILMVLVFYDIMQAQVSPPRAVLSSIGEDSIVCSVAWFYNIDIEVVNSYTYGNLKLTHGFQQPNIAICGGYQNKPELPINIYPTQPKPAASLVSHCQPRRTLLYRLVFMTQ
jgi:hypothetical protein